MKRGKADGVDESPRGIAEDGPARGKVKNVGPDAGPTATVRRAEAALVEAVALHSVCFL
jgi:hypothetical protein